MASLPLLFGSVFTGAVIIDYGVKNLRTAWAKGASSSGTAAAPSTAGGAPVNVKGLANPFAHGGWTIGRSDAGVDASAAPGTPLAALASGKIVEILSGWYNGQNLYLVKTDQPYDTPGGPQNYYYYAEGINSSLKVGDAVAAGQTFGTYYGSNGIEIGIGDPTSNSRTLAGAMGLGDKAPPGSPGVWFRSVLGQLGAHV